jgi:hypothetical protein
MAEQWDATNYKEPGRQRIYLKDIDCPPVWHEKLKDLLPQFLFYLNESTGNSENDIACAGDLMSSLPTEMRADNLMCYIGPEGTYTPAHREMCASIGHNIMVETSTGLAEDGRPTKPGSSIWFMTDSKDRHLVSEYWLSALGHDIEIEDHFAQINAWKAAPFKTYVVEQKVGDFILIPPLAPHQVWNRGTRTMKVAWNRTTVETLELALNEAMPRARMVCRDEQYKNKAIVYSTLEKYSRLLDKPAAKTPSRQTRQVQKDFRRLFSLFTTILLSESFSPHLPPPKKLEYLPFTSNVICSYCRCNIFNRFLTCPSCVGKLPDGDDDCYDICMECYALGRSCACISKLKWIEQFRWKDLLNKYETWRQQILNFTSRGEDSAQFRQSFDEIRKQFKKRTLTEVCLAESKRRPWNDVSKPWQIPDDKNDEEIVEVNDDGQVRKRRKIRRSDTWRKQHGNCHICRTPDPIWKVATCSKCELNYCYGSLFRAFDMSPLAVLEDPAWKCPKCRKICSCGTCRRDPSMKPFAPTGTLLGHDTRNVADPRSVESLVDFSHSNIGWLKKAGDHLSDLHKTSRLRKKLEEAEKAKSDEATLEDHYVDHYDEDIPNHELPPEMQEPNAVESPSGQIPIDPALMSTSSGPGGSLFVLSDRAVFQKELSDRYQVTEAVTFEDPEARSVPSHPLPHNNGNSGPILNPKLQPPQAEPVGEYASLYPEATIQSEVRTNKRGHGRRAADDEDFNPRRRNRPEAAAGKPTKKGKRSIHDESDSPADDDGPALLPIQQPSTSKSGSATRRSSRRITSAN